MPSNYYSIAIPSEEDPNKLTSVRNHILVLQVQGEHEESEAMY